MASLETFDSEVKELVSSGKLSASRVKSVTDAAMANISHDAHLVATLFKLHKQAKASHKLSSLYIIDAIAREAKQTIKKGKDKGKSTNSPTSGILSPSAGDNDDGFDGRKLKSKGNCASFLSKIESFLDRLVAEVLSKGPPEHKEKVKKVLDIWNKTSTFSPEALKSAYAKLNGEADPPGQDYKDRSVASSRPTPNGQSARSTTPPYPPPDPPIRFPALPPPPIAFPATSAYSATTSQLPTTNLLTSLAGDQLASLLALTSGASAPQASFANPASAPAPAPAFESSQLALLQQLASQTGPNSSGIGSSSSSSQLQNLPASALTSLAESLTSLPASQQSISSYSNTGHYDTNRGRPSDSWEREDSNFDSKRRRRDDDRRDSPPRNSSSRWGDETSRRDRRRSASPPPRPSDSGWGRRQQEEQPSNGDARAKSLAAWKEKNLGGPAASGGAGNAIPVLTQPEPIYSRGSFAQTIPEGGRIATFVSSEFDEETSARKSRRAAQTRNEFDAVDLSSFEVSTTASMGGNAIPTTYEDHSQSFNAQNQQQQQDDEETPASLLLRNVKPFDPMSFDPFQPECWASFANMCLSLYGYMPSNTEMVQLMMMKMSMMGAGPAGGMGNMGQENSQGSMSDDPAGPGYVASGHGGNAGTPEDGKSRSASEQEGQGQTAGNVAEEAAPEELGEADMDVTSDEDK